MTMPRLSIIISGEIRGWGVTEDGSLGDTPSSKESRGKCFSPGRLLVYPYGVEPSRVFAGGASTFLVGKMQGTSCIFACGDNENGQLGLPHRLVDELTKIGDMEVANIVASNNQTIFLDVHGEVTACAAPEFTTIEQSTPHSKPSIIPEEKEYQEIIGILDRASITLDSVGEYAGAAEVGIELNGLMGLLWNTEPGSLSPERIWTLYRLLLSLPNENLGLTEMHYNVMLRHLLWEYVDAPNEFGKPMKNVKWGEFPIPSRIREIVDCFESDMKFMDLKPDGETLSYFIIANRHNPTKLEVLWSTSKTSHKLKVFAYDTIIRSFAKTLTQINTV
ncbi:hypothetical protein HDU67_001116, partial [Dinochytrium kinnereticum]